MVYGPKSVGKTRTLEELRDQWRNDSRLVIDLDLKDDPYRVKDVGRLLWKFLQQEGDRLRLTFLQIAGEEAAERLEEGSTHLRVPNIRASEVAQTAKGVVSAFRQGDGLEAGLDALQNYIRERELPRQTEYQIFLGVLERLHKKTSCRPILMIREAQNLASEEGEELAPELFKALLASFKSRKQGNSNVPVIFETSEFLWAKLLEYIVASEQSFEAYEVKEWLKDEGRKVLVPNIFTEEEFEKVWDLVGGHVGELFELHRLLRRGATLDEAIQGRLAAKRAYLNAQLVAQKGPDFDEIKKNVTESEWDDWVWDRRMSLLRLLKKHNWELPLAQVRQQKGLKKCSDYLCEANVLWQRQDPNVLVPVHSTMRNAIIRHLDENPEVVSSGDDRLGGA
uniref:AAA+ ATPase domain-containing protein n=1 Tax=Chromera velia CCMP2878 TaxID=1169474 RepID=A0A0G4FIE4_9ALVE|eukprot:Cvel_17167.t1-p1 / transcript=Cvel_17167.t1 / gene=Cvel_17167 / organism=Chromera_velia_CCMP2878 / gene_product=hypothetical protein / transcript_product=hypothetical protein / location=Cvel_scaffold1357:2158-3336(-) / protein_length=393 / sequence_SO=supercontig / SO=protein_coding / is_pseudo=false